MSKKITQFEYSMIKAAWQRNGDKELAVLLYFEEIDIHNHMPLSDRIEQAKNIVKHDIKWR